MIDFQLFKGSIADLSKRDLEEITSLLNYYYEESTGLLLSELKKNNRVYYYRKTGENIEAFFMTGWSEVSIHNEKRISIYLGLSCVNNQYKERKLGSKLYYEFTKEALELQSKISDKVLLYGTTATPVVLLTLPKIWDNVEPNQDGSYSNHGEKIIRRIQKELDLDKFSTGHPYVLKKIAFKTRYAESERIRFKDISEKFDLRTFEILDIDETQGDRMMILCNLPSEIKFQKLERKLFAQIQDA